ncbi:alkaline phosphatase [Bowdeniella massiliensis]|uniref:alkaline phosphatase n=1 Tax=Bowdeniella massiliensis TaxID=2932264 RepID=UPI002028CD84|nr:alkaline phosphatase [Bowdeniella massiliensis]
MSRFIVSALAAATLVAGGLAATPVAADSAPKNVIVLIGDGMGYNHIDNASSYLAGTTRWQVEWDPASFTGGELGGTPSQEFETWNRVSQQTFPVTGSYDPKAAWSDFNWVKKHPTDSAAAGTALATGVKTINGYLGVDAYGKAQETIAERAKRLGKSAGVVSSVPFSHATPAAYVAHNISRNNYHDIATEMIASDMDVIIGAGHPHFDDSNQAAVANYKYVNEADFTALKQGKTDFSFLETTAELTALASGETPERVFGLPQVASTLQQSRAGESTVPFDVANNDVPDLPTLTAGALNVLDNNDEGFFLMVEGGAIDWTGHANDEVRNIEETVDFFDAVSTVSQWVEANSSWEETLVIVTADHETGYLVGPESDPAFDAMTGNKGEVPKLSWHSGDHTNMLVPVFFKGAGAATLAAHATGEDPVRGAFLDNTALANFLLEDLWRAAEPTEEPTEQPTEAPTEAPTEQPTEAPTEQPTEAPTEQPTAEPSEKPTHDAKPLPIGPKQPGKPIASAPKMPVTGGELIMLALLASGLISSGVVLVRRRQAS